MTFSNWVTGKLSDFVGLLITPMLISYFFPKRKRTNTIVIGLLFIFWKSPSSQTLIDLYNQYALIKIARIIDYSDLIALAVLPISYKIMNNMNRLRINHKTIKPIFIIIPSVFVFMATSPPKYMYYSNTIGEITFYKCNKTVRLDRTKIIELLAKNNYKIKHDDGINSFFKQQKQYRATYLDSTFFYKIDTITLNTDTILDLRFSLQKISEEKTRIWINSMTFTQKVPDSLINHKLKKTYSRALKKHFKKILVD